MRCWSPDSSRAAATRHATWRSPRTGRRCTSASDRGPMSTTPTRRRRKRIARRSSSSTRMAPAGASTRRGIRNAVGLAVHPTTGQLWVSVNERDNLGDNLVPDYITHVEDGGFYGWPWYYIGGNQDPRHAGKHPELKASVKVPDVLLQPHSASLEMVFYNGQQFPAEHRDSIFSASHGSWNKATRTGLQDHPHTTAGRQADRRATRTSSRASSLLTARSGVVPWASPSPPTAHSSSPTMPRTRSGEWHIRGRNSNEETSAVSAISWRKRARSAKVPGGAKRCSFRLQAEVPRGAKVRGCKLEAGS